VGDDSEAMVRKNWRTKKQKDKRGMVEAVDSLTGDV
jgi:hypothetical protein